jgi:hypothetical protein
MIMSEVLTLNMKLTVICDMTPSSLADGCQCFGGICYIHLQCRSNANLILDLFNILC